MIDCSLIISFYNRIDYLKLVLAGLERQTFRNFEIILADDGSNQNVISEIESLSKQISFPFIHVWQEDKGFRKNSILNSAIRVSSADYLIFIDGDFFPHRNFFNKKKRGLLGCNLSIHKADIKKINGFDERYQAPSIGEDSDIQFRLELLGIKIKTLNNIAIQYHLYHELQKRPEKNLELFAQVRKSAQHFTPYGLNKYF